MLLLEASYDGIGDERDTVFITTVNKHGGVVSGSGCFLIGQPVRDLEAEFDDEEKQPDREAIERELRAAGSWLHISWSEADLDDEWDAEREGEP